MTHYNQYTRNEQIYIGFFIYLSVCFFFFLTEQAYLHDNEELFQNKIIYVEYFVNIC